MRPSIDISIVTYNSAKWLEGFFDSLLAQNYPTKYLNIYAMDNNSGDNTFSLLEGLQKKYKQHFAAFDISEGPNKGFGYGHNRNFEKGQSDYFLVTNVDLTFEHNSIPEIVKAVLEDTKHQFASFEFRQKPYEHPKYYDPVTLETRWSSSACILFRRDIFQKVKGYEERIFLYGEDVELSYRLRDKGYKLRYCPKAVCWHYSYGEANEVKAAQYFGSIMGHLRIRLRYGALKDILAGCRMLLRVFFTPVPVAHRIRTLFKNMLRFFRDIPYFLKTRKKSNIPFMFKGWDYDWRREGAFYVLEPLIEKTPPLVSVIIRTHGERITQLKEAIQSVCNQTYPAIELIVIEDGKELAKSLMMKLETKKYLQKIVYQSIEKSGRCVAGNKGLELATGEFIVFLDDDDLFFADHIEVLVQALLKSPEVGAVYSLAWEEEEGSHTFKLTHNQPFTRHMLWEHNYLPIQSVLFRRSLYQTLGGFDASLDALEDWDLWMRYANAYPFERVEKLTSLYRVPPADSEKAMHRKKYFEKYHLVMLEKQKKMFLPTMSIGEVVILVREMAEERMLLNKLYRLTVWIKKMRKIFS